MDLILLVTLSVKIMFSFIRLIMYKFLIASEIENNMDFLLIWVRNIAVFLLLMYLISKIGKKK